MTLIKSISGIRGTIGGPATENLTPLDIVKFTTAYVRFIAESAPGKRLKIVVGRDARISGEMVGDIIEGTLLGCGADVVNIGLCTTPGTELAVTAHRADGGIIITASHNPRQWNALKLLNSDGEFLTDAEGKRALRARVTQDIYAQRCQQARAVAEQALIAQLGTHVTGPLPKQLVAGNYFAEQRQFNLRMQANGVNFDQYLKVQGQTVEEFRAWLHAEAERKLRSRMGLLLVAQKEELWPTEAEVDDELAHWDAKRDGEHTFASNDRRRAAQRIASSRAAAFILAHSTLTPPPAEATVLKAENR